MQRTVADIFLHNPFVDRIVYFEPKDSKLKTIYSLWKQIRELKVTHALMLIPHETINYALFAAGVPYRSGVGTKFYQTITGTKSVYRRGYEQARSEHDYAFDQLRKLGVNPLPINPEIFLSDEELASKNLLREQLLRGKKYLIGLHTTHGKSAPNIRPDEYRKLFELLSADSRISLICTDKDIPTEVKNIPGVLYPLEVPGLREAIVHFSALDWLISASTGPMHVASAVGVKTLSLFCPLPACMPELWGPGGENAHYILPEEGYCSKVCGGKPSTCDFSGPGGINAEGIAEKLFSLL